MQVCLNDEVAVRTVNQLGCVGQMKTHLSLGRSGLGVNSVAIVYS